MKKIFIALILLITFSTAGYGFNLEGIGRLNLPQINEPATPTLSFGDGDSGFYESADDVLRISVGGEVKFGISITAIYSAISSGGKMTYTAATATFPAHSFYGDEDTGLGLANVDQLSLIAGGVEAMRLTEVAGGVQAIVPLSNTPATPTIAFGDGDSGFYENQDDTIGISIAGSAGWYISSTALGTLTTGYPSIRYAAATATVPNHLPAQNDVNTGLGSAGEDILSLIAGGVEGHRITEAAGLIDHVLTGMVKTPTTQTLTDAAGAGVIDIVSAITHIVSTGTDALSLANGAEGQWKSIVMKTDGGAATLTPTSPGNFSTLTFDDVGDSALLIFTNGKWIWMGGTATKA